MRPGLENYVEVKDRLPLFWARFPDGRVETELIFYDERGVCVKAFLWDAEVLRSTGYAHEVPGQGAVNKTSALENCETSAIGRALANLDIRGPNGNEPRPSREEMTKAKRGQDPAASNESRKELAGLLERLEGAGLTEQDATIADNAMKLAADGGPQSRVDGAIKWARGILKDHPVEAMAAEQKRLAGV